MKKKIVLILGIFASLILSAQNNVEPKYLLTTKSCSLGFSMLSFIDPYLSPVVYSGSGLTYVSDSRRYFSKNNDLYSSQSRFRILGGSMLNPTSTSEMIYLGINYGWGANYHFRLNDNLRILTGGLLDVDVAFKDISRNINNPVNLDLATNLNFTGLLLYDIHLKKRTLQLQVAIQTPIAGYMFVPFGGASYYDMFELGSLTDAFHFSSAYNKRGLDQTYTVNVPFNSITWRLGVRLHNLKYKANELVFKQSGVSFIVGASFDVITFGGRKRTAPANFISTNN